MLLVEALITIVDLPLFVRVVSPVGATLACALCEGRAGLFAHYCNLSAQHKAGALYIGS